MTSIVNLKARKLVEMEIYLEEIESGQIELDVNTQFYPNYLKSAIEKIGSVDCEKFWKRQENASTMSTAVQLSDWQVSDELQHEMDAYTR